MSKNEKKKMGDKELNRESAQIFQQPKDMIFVFGISEELRTTGRTRNQ